MPAQTPAQSRKSKPANPYGVNISKPRTAVHHDSGSEDDVEASKDLNESYGRSAMVVYLTYGGLKLMEQHPKLQEVLRGAVFKVIVDFLFDDTFPVVTSRAPFVQVILVAVARQKNAPEIKNRVREDISFSKAFAPMVCCLVTLDILLY